MEKRSLKIKLVISALLLLLSVAVAIPSFAWFVKTGMVAYAPVASNQALYIGAGHIQLKEVNGDNAFDTDYPFEDVRYLYLEGIDTSSNDDGTAYKDFVFCVYGEGISKYKLQLAYTTNNQFVYEIYDATEATADSPGAVRYDVHDDTEGHTPTYYYTATGGAIAGTYLNVTTDESGNPVADENGKVLADSTKHNDTYIRSDSESPGVYDSSKVNKYAEPIYWQTASSINGSPNAFVHYFILRVWENSKHINDRETDVICIAAKSISGSS